MNPVALLGSGPSINKTDLHAFQMPFISINDSWRFWPNESTRVFIDWHLQGGPCPARCVYPEDGSVKRPLPWACDMIPVPWRIRDGRKPKFNGFNLDQGTDAAFGGMLALEYAVWIGHNPIYLLGFDCVGAHSYSDTKIISSKTLSTWRTLLEESLVVCKERGIDVIQP